jgi:hypothetical protein
MRFTKCFYGGCAIGLGAWETLAFTGYAPTITRTCRRYKHRRAVQALVLAWTAGLALHLLSDRA